MWNNLVWILIIIVTVNQGDRIAQLILERYEEAEVLEAKELPESQRGDGGFGSTGVSKRLKPDSEGRS